MITKPTYSIESAYFNGYIQKASGNDLIAELRASQHRTSDFINGLSEEQGSYRYAEGKWTVKQLLQHLTDTERVFVYRALSFSRKDETSLPPFEEDLFAANDGKEHRTLKAVLEEFEVVRKGTLLFFQSLSEEALDRWGTANHSKQTARVVGWILVGHNEHHLQVLKERYQ